MMKRFKFVAVAAFCAMLFASGFFLARQLYRMPASIMVRPDAAGKFTQGELNFLKRQVELELQDWNKQRTAPQA